MNARETIANLEDIAHSFAEQTAERQRRTSLDPADFDKLADAGFLLTGVPVEAGGFWREPAGCARDYTTMLRTIAHGDPNVALVAAMHPAVTAFFLAARDVDDAPDAWRAQRETLIESFRTEWWGTIMSEPGSGGDLMKTRTSVEEQSGQYTITGDKHFGSGSGHARWMITTGVLDGSDVPELFFMQYSDEPWDGSTGCQLMVEWAGICMSATQSHAFRFKGFPVTKTASSQVLERSSHVTGQMSSLMFTAVVLGVADNARAFAEAKINPRRAGLRPYERVEWLRCQNHLWLAEQAFQGALLAVEREDENVIEAVLRCKITCAELVETALASMARVVGGASYSRAMPLAQWIEDVKALGFLRPPLPLAYDQLFELDHPSG